MILAPGQRFKLFFFVLVVCGLTTTFSRLEVVKTIQQIGTAEGGDFFSTVRNIWEIEGFWGFFKANLARFHSVYCICEYFLITILACFL